MSRSPRRKLLVVLAEVEAVLEEVGDEVQAKARLPSKAGAGCTCHVRYEETGERALVEREQYLHTAPASD